MSGMHADEVVVEDEQVRRLLAAQHPEWASLPLRRLPPVGTDNQLFRLGDELLLRFPRIHWAADSAEWEHTWLPRLAPYSPVEVPAPVALGEPGEGYPWHWTVVPWIEGETPTPETFDPEEWGDSLGRFVRVVRDVPGMDAPVKTEGRGAPLPNLDEWVRTWTERADPSLVDRDAVLALWEDVHADRYRYQVEESPFEVGAYVEWAASVEDEAAERRARRERAAAETPVP